MGYFNSFEFQEQMQNTSEGEEFSYNQKDTTFGGSLFTDEPQPVLEPQEETYEETEPEEPTEKPPFIINSEVARRIEEIENEEKPKFPYTDEETKGLGPTFTSGYVAKVFDISSQQVRNITQMFYELLDVSRKPGGAVEYTINAIAQIAAILRIKERNNLTFEQTKQVLLSPEGKILTAGTEFEQFKELLNYSNQAVQEAVKETMKEATAEMANIMLQLSREVHEISAKQDENKLLLEDSKKESASTLLLLEEREKEIEEYKKLSLQQQQTAESLERSLNERSMQLEKMIEENEKLTTLLKEKMEQENKPKKRWIFGK